MSGGFRLLLTADAIGGVWQYAVELAGALAPHGVETVLAALGPPPSVAQRAEAEAVPGLRLVETGLALDWLSDGPGPVLAAGAAIAQLARDEAVDLVHVNMPALAAAAPAGVPVVAAAHGCVATWWQAAWPGVPLDPAFEWSRRLTGEGLRAADCVVAPSAAHGRTVARQYGLPHVPAVVHNGRRPFLGQNPAPLTDTALTVGRLWDRAKRADILDRVAARLSVPFEAAGAVQGPHGETVRLDHLRPLGQVDAPTLAARLAARPVFVSSACFEPFGLAVLEAASAGCALVLSEIATFRELWDGAALFVGTEDEAAYARAIERLVGDPALRRRMGDAARERAGRYTPTAMGAAMMGVYARLLDARQGARAA